MGLVEQLDSGAFYMTDIELMIGQSSTEAERKRAARLENKALLPPRTKGGHLSDIRPPEIEIELEKEIEIEKEREGETGHPVPAAYGRYNNVILTDTELSGLKTELPDKWEYYIDRLSCHIASTGKQYHSHAATIYKWAQEDVALLIVIIFTHFTPGLVAVHYRIFFQSYRLQYTDQFVQVCLTFLKPVAQRVFRNGHTHIYQPLVKKTKSYILYINFVGNSLQKFRSGPSAFKTGYYLRMAFRFRRTVRN